RGDHPRERHDDSDQGEQGTHAQAAEQNHQHLVSPRHGHLPSVLPFYALVGPSRKMTPLASEPRVDRRSRCPPLPKKSTPPWSGASPRSPARPNKRGSSRSARPAPRSSATARRRATPCLPR